MYILIELKAIVQELTYSRLPNRRVGWNKGVGGKIAGNLINKLDGIHLLSFISNAVLVRPFEETQNFDGVAYIAQEISHFCCLASEF